MKNNEPTLNKTPPTSNSQPAVVPPTTSVPGTQPIPTNKTQWLMISLIVVLLGAIGYLGFQNYQLKQQLADQLQPDTLPSPQKAVSSPLPTASPTTVIDSMAGWKTYTNTTYNFSIKYPPIWKDITSEETIKYGNKGFDLETDKKEKVHLVVFEEISADNQNDTATRKSINLKSGNSLLFTYVKCDGPGCEFGEQDIDIFTQIVSSFKLIN